MRDRYAVIGNPIRQSKSPIIHAAFAASCGHAIDYDPIEAPDAGFVPAVDAFRTGGGRGLNVTAPFKRDAAAYADVLHERARLAGAVNCLRFEEGRVEAENFDGVGLLRDLQHNLGCALDGRRVLVLGAGGATRGALAPLLAAGPTVVVVANRTPATAQALAESFAVDPIGLDALATAGSFDLVINATSAGLRGEAMTLPLSIFGAGALAYDMTYGKGLTDFLRSAAAAGLSRLHDGVGMLVEQAAEAFAWWRGIRPETRAVIERIAVPLR